MKKPLFTIILLIGLGLLFSKTSLFQNINTGAPPYDSQDEQYPEMDRYEWLKNWKRPEGPAKVGLQVGHWKNDDLPEELNRLKGSTGATGGGKSEWEVNLQIAYETARILEEHGVIVEVLPAKVPVQFWADVFVAIHADGNLDQSKSGFKTAAPRRDYTQKAEKLASQIEQDYQQATGLAKDPNITRNMRGYYAFAWWRYDHAVHPMTTSVILESGFLTNPNDRKLLIGNPETAAAGLSSGIINFLVGEGLL